MSRPPSSLAPEHRTTALELAPRRSPSPRPARAPYSSLRAARSTRSIGALAAVLLLASPLGGGCDKKDGDDAQETAQEPNADAATGTAPAAADDAAASAGGPGPDEGARVAMIAAEIDCAAARHEEQGAQDAAIDAILARAELDRGRFDALVDGLADDPTFAATRDQAFALCDRPSEGGDEGEDMSMRAKVKALTIAAECMRRRGLSDAQVSDAVRTLYASHGVTLEAYANEMTRLADDASFQDEVARGIEACPAAADVDADGDDEDPSDEADSGDDPGDEDPSGAPDDGDDPGDAPDDGDDPDGGDDPDSGDDPGDEDPSDEPDAGEPDDGDADPDDEADADSDDEDPAPTRSGRYSGAVRGSPRGTVTFTIRGNQVANARIVIGGVGFRPNARIVSGRVVLSGKRGDDFVRMSGRINAARGTVAGEWTGVIKRKRASGSFTAKR